MGDVGDEVLRHRYVYVPWTRSEAISTAAPKMAKYLMAQHHQRLTVVCPTKQNAPEALSRYDIVTERSGRVRDGGVVLVYCPTYRLVRKFAHLESSVVLLVEWATESFEGWAKLIGAYNAVSRSVMTAGLSEEGREALEGVVFEGYKGWHDDMAVRATNRHLAALSDLGEYDREVVLAYARRDRGEDGIKRLYPILATFETTAARPIAGA